MIILSKLNYNELFKDINQKGLKHMMIENENFDSNEGHHIVGFIITVVIATLSILTIWLLGK